MLLNSHILVYFRPAYVLNTGKWNEESTDYYSNIIEERLTLPQEEAEIERLLLIMAANW